jgi:serine/threonine protein phosphatase 1
MGRRTVVVGDIHGCSDALVTLIAPGIDDMLVTLGDYIDRCPNSCGVLDQLIALAGRCRLVPFLDVTK